MDPVEFENKATGSSFQSLEQLFESSSFSNEQRQATTQFKMLFDLPVVEKKSKCTNPLCQSTTFVEYSIQASRADEPAILVHYCSRCGRKQ